MRITEPSSSTTPPPVRAIFFKARSRRAPLAELLAAAIEATCAAHSGTCDLDNPASPSATVAMVREHSGQLDVLVLCDCVVVLDTVDGVRVVTDDRNAGMTPAQRNIPGGFWVAGTRPDSARHAAERSEPPQAREDRRDKHMDDATAVFLRW
ncbi:hypothetical protein [Streptomyces sp. NPDC051183]|uniref:hypothetical protein n=1 Tax=Streptomyces sp. NPDC051183 TaxID=3155165 RepID=UPI0034451D70